MGIAGRWFFGPHAVRRFIERSPFHDLTYAEALAILMRQSEGAHFIRRAAGKCEIWRGPAPLRMRFVIGPGEGALPAVRTVRPPHRTTVVRVTETGVVTHQLGDLVSTHACAACGIPFAARAKNQVTCGRKKCRAVMSYSKRRDDVEDRKRRRARFTRWYNENRERVIANVMARKKAA